MRSFLLVLVLGLLAGGLLAEALRERDPHAASWPALRPDTAWGAYDYTLFEESLEGDYDLVARLPVDAPQGMPTIRLVTGYRDGQTYTVLEPRPGAEGWQALRVEAGLARELRPKESAPTSGTTPASARSLRLRRRGERLELLAGGTRILTFADAGPLAGHAGTGLPGSGPAPESLETSIQPIAPIAFNDDFMRASGDVSQWRPESGDWQVAGLENPSRSSNAFVYKAIAPEGGTSLLGAEHWEDYRFAASVFGAEGGAVGLVVCDRPGAGRVLVEWTADPPDGGDEADAALRVYRVSPDGGRDLATEVEGGYRPRQWYRLEAVALDGALSVRIDGREMLRQDFASGLEGGAVGLYARAETPVEFDDVEVRSYLGTLPGEMPGEPQTAAADPARLLAGREDGSAWALRASAAFGASVDPTRKRTTRFAGPWRGPLDHVLYEIDWRGATPIRHRLLRVTGPGGLELVKEAPLSGTPDAAGALRLEWPVELRLDRGVLQARVGEEASLGLWLGRNASGRAGALATGGVPLATVRLDPVGPPLPVANVNQVFDEEALMAAWSGVAGDWRISEGGGAYQTVCWHRAYFFGDVSLEAAFPGTEALGENALAFALSVCKPVEPETKENGYILQLDGTLEEGLALTLRREAEEVSATRLPAGVLPHRLRLRRAGSILVASVDDRPALVWDDPEPLVGRKVAWAVRGMRIEPADVEVYNDNLLSYSFNSAPVDWRVGSGVWEVTNRWECDPRWSFWAGMTGRTARRRISELAKRFTEEERQWKIRNLELQVDLLEDPDNPHAVLWHKRSFDGDLVLEAFVGQVMDRSRGGYEKYVRDFNITLCGNGQDLAEGYHCVLGGWQNTRSAILRNGEIAVQAAGNMLAGAQVHRRWIRLRVEREGAGIYFTAHTQTARNAPEALLADLYFEDPEPLSGKRVAIWTYEGGMLVARARIAAERALEREPPRFGARGTPMRSFYDLQEE